MKTSVLRVHKKKIHALRCDTLFAHTLGLMFRRNTNAFFVFPRPVRHTVHGLFCLQELQLLFLDHTKRVIEISVLKPWGLYRPTHAYSYLIELSTPVQGIKYNEKVDIYSYTESTG